MVLLLFMIGGTISLAIYDRWNNIPCYPELKIYGAHADILRLFGKAPPHCGDCSGLQSVVIMWFQVG